MSWTNSLSLRTRHIPVTGSRLVFTPISNRFTLCCDHFDRGADHSSAWTSYLATIDSDVRLRRRISYNGVKLCGPNEIDKPVSYYSYTVGLHNESHAITFDSWMVVQHLRLSKSQDKYLYAWKNVKYDTPFSFYHSTYTFIKQWWKWCKMII